MPKRKELPGTVTAKKKEVIASIVVSGLKKMNALFRYQINQAVLLVDSPGPDAGAESFQRLGFAFTGEWLAHDRFD
jgi:hypothetical protein